MKDDSGSHAAFTEQGPSASQTTAATVMDVMTRLPGCAGQAPDAVSAYTQVRMEDAPKLLTIPKSDTLAVLNLGQLCEEHWYSHEWTEGQSPNLMKHNKTSPCKQDNVVPIVAPRVTKDEIISVSADGSAETSRSSVFG